MTQEQRAQQLVERLMHNAHLQYQREQLRKDAVTMECSEVRGVKRKRTASEINAYSQQFRPEWFTHLRPNFWKAYFESLIALNS